jgi:L-fuconate dehydratase
MNPDPDYSAAYVVLTTDQAGLEGHGLTFTLGRGNELCVAAIEALAPLVVGRRLSDITGAMGAYWRELVSASQLRWVGPEKGVIHLATAGLVNALWDLWAKLEGKPVWRLVAEMSSSDRCSPPHRFPLSQRCAHAGRALAILKTRVRQGKAHCRAGGEGLSRLHHLGRLAGLFR